jgi:hypothetical protein
MLTDKSRGQDAGDRLRFDILAIGGWLGNWQPFLSAIAGHFRI